MFIRLRRLIEHAAGQCAAGTEHTPAVKLQLYTCSFKLRLFLCRPLPTPVTLTHPGPSASLCLPKISYLWGYHPFDRQGQTDGRVPNKRLLPFMLSCLGFLFCRTLYATPVCDEHVQLQLYFFQRRMAFVSSPVDFDFPCIRPGHTFKSRETDKSVLDFPFHHGICSDISNFLRWPEVEANLAS